MDDSGRAVEGTTSGEWKILDLAALDAHDRALARWCGLAGADGGGMELSFGEWAEGLVGYSVEARACAAVAALELACEVDVPDPWGRPDALAEAVAAWLEEPGSERHEQVVSALQAVDELHRILAGDRGPGGSSLLAACHAGRVVTQPALARSVVHAVTGAARGAGEEQVRAQVEGAVLRWLTTRGGPPRARRGLL